MHDSLDRLRDLSNAFGVSGFEDEVRDRLRELAQPLVDQVQVDVMGNLIATRRGAGSTTLMIDAHMDEVGFMVSYIEENGFLRFSTIGGWDARIIPAHTMTIATERGTKVKGVIGTLPPHVLRPDERERPFKLEDLFIDIGAPSAEAVAELGIRIGSPAVIAYPFEQLNEQFVVGKALDDRAGCLVALRVLEALGDQSIAPTIVVNFAVREEVGLLGAGTAAYTIAPDLALVLESTIGADMPGVPPARQPTRLGLGPAITVADSSHITNPSVVRAFSRIAESEGIPYQYKLPPFGGTDAGSIQKAGGGVLTGIVSIPCRYIHSPFNLMRLDDFENTVRLATAIARRSGEVIGS